MNLFDTLPDPMPADPPPAQRHSPTSVAAADAIEPKAATLRRAVLDWLRARGPVGGTDEEIQDGLSMAQNTQRPRRRELQTAGWVTDSGRTRKTRSGREAVVWVATGPDVKDLSDVRQTDQSISADATTHQQ